MGWIFGFERHPTLNINKEKRGKNHVIRLVETRIVRRLDAFRSGVAADVFGDTGGRVRLQSRLMAGEHCGGNGHFVRRLRR